MRYLSYIAQANYSCESYGEFGYNECSPSVAPSTPTDSGALANTGYDIIIPVAFALALIIASGILFAKRALRRRD